MLAIGASVAALCGLVAATLRPLDPLALGLGALVAGSAAALTGRLRAARAGALFILVAALAALRVAAWPAATSDALEPLVGERVTLQGRVASTPTFSGGVVAFRLEVAYAARLVALGQLPFEARSGRVEVIAAVGGAAGSLQVGDWISAEGKLAPPASAPGYPRAALLARQGVFSVMAFPRLALLEGGTLEVDALASRLSVAIRRAFERSLPQPEASLAASMLLGGSAELGPAVKQDLQSAGLGHLVAVSGYNIVVVAAAANAVLSRSLGRRWSLLPVLVAIAGYTLLAGAPPSAVRAALMAGASLVAGAVGRLADPLASVLLAAAVMAAAQPPVLLDVGFQLSFAATVGLVLLEPRVRPWLRRLPGWLAEPLALATAAELATLPIVLSVFHQLTVVGPLANVVAAPLVPLVMASGALLAMVLPLGTAVAQVIGWAVWLPAAALAGIAHLAASLPGATLFTGRFPPEAAAALGGALLAWGLWPAPELAPSRALLRRAIGVPLGLRMPLGLLGTLAALSVALLLARPDGRLHVTTLGSGPLAPVLVRGPNGATVLVSGEGVDPRGLASLVADRLNAWERGLDAVVVMNPGDEPGLVEVLRRYAVGQRFVADRDLRLTLGAAVLDLYAGGSTPPSLAASLGEVWIPLRGAPPVGASSAAGLAPLAVRLEAADWSASYPAPILTLRQAPATGGWAPAPVEVASDGRRAWANGLEDLAELWADPRDDRASAATVPAR